MSSTRYMRILSLICLFYLMIHYVHSHGEAACACRHSARWTRDCCGPTGGYFIYRKCYQTFGLSFIQCCRHAGFPGACVA